MRMSFPPKWSMEAYKYCIKIYLFVQMYVIYTDYSHIRFELTWYPFTVCMYNNHKLLFEHKFKFIFIHSIKYYAKFQ